MAAPTKTVQQHYDPCALKTDEIILHNRQSYTSLTDSQVCRFIVTRQHYDSDLSLAFRLRHGNFRVNSSDRMIPSE